MHVKLKYLRRILYIAQILKDANFSYALLKGACLTSQLYEEGLRTSNDIDILIKEEDISKLQEILVKNGFIQGFYYNIKGILPAARRDILKSRMNYGETIPFVKLVDDIPLEIDINFSLDYKPEIGNSLVALMLEKIVDVSYEDITFKSLSLDDFFIHLCCHLFKEATIYNWLKLKRDLELYKFNDINLMIHENFNDKYIEQLIKRIFKMNVEKECYYAVYNTAVLFPCLYKINGLADFLKRIKPDDLGFMKEIIDPEKRKIYYYELDFIEWFKLNNRCSHLHLKDKSNEKKI